MSADDTPREFEIDDPEELSQKKRVRDILNRRNEVLEARNRALDEELLGQTSHEEALGHYQSRIQSLILDLYTKFKGLEDDAGEELLEREHIDTITVHPPAEIMPDTQQDMAAGVDPPEPKEVPIHGLEWFIENDPVVSAEFTVYSWNPPGEKTAIGQRMVPIKTLDKALLACMEFIDRVGIDANLNETEQQTKIDRDLLEEVDKWRQQNVE